MKRLIFIFLLVVLILSFSAIHAQEGMPNSEEELLETIMPSNAEQLSQLSLFKEVTGVNDVAISPDGKILALAGGSGAVHLLEMSTGGVIAELYADIRRMNTVAFSPDGSLLAAGGFVGQKGAVQLWDMASKQPLLRLEAFEFTIHDIAFGLDGTSLAIASGNPWGAPGLVQLWDIETNKLITEFEQLAVCEDDVGCFDTPTVYGLDMNPDGTLLATANGDGSVRLWDIATEHETILNGHTGWVYGVAFSPDGNLLASSGTKDFQDAGGEIRIWDIGTSQEHIELGGHSEPVYNLAFSPDGRILVSASSFDDTVQLWDTSTWETLSTLNVPLAHSVAFSPDGTILVTSGWDGTVHFWGVVP